MTGEWQFDGVSDRPPVGTFETYQVDLTAGPNPGCQPTTEPPRLPGRDVRGGDYLYPLPPDGFGRLTVLRSPSDRLVFALAASADSTRFRDEADVIVRSVRPTNDVIGEPSAGADGIRALGAFGATAGRYRARNVKPALEFDLPAGWSVGPLSASSLEFSRTAGEATVRLEIRMSRLILSDPSCGDQFTPVTPGLLERILRDPTGDFHFSGTETFQTLSGAATTRFDDVTITDSCPGTPGGGWHPQGLSGLERADTVWVADVPESTSVVIGYTIENADIDGARAEADRIVRSLTLAPPVAEAPEPVLDLAAGPRTDLVPIRWQVESVGPGFVLDPGDGWRVETNDPGSLTLSRRARPDQQQLKFLRPASWMAGPCGSLRPDAVRWADAVAANDGVRYGAIPTPSPIGRILVARMPIEGRTACTEGGVGSKPTVPLLALDDGSTVGLEADRAYRMYLVYADWLGGLDDPLVLLLDGETESHLVALVLAVEPLLLDLSPP